MPNNPFVIPKGLASADGTLAAGSQVSIDDTPLTNVMATDVQDVATELERLFGIVQGIQNDRAREDRPLNLFDSAVSFTSTNLPDFINRNNIYSASTNQRVNFVLPAESLLTGQYPAIFEIQNLGGTQRFDSGISPTNTVVITRPSDYSASDPSTFLRRDSATGTNLQFAELHRGDTAIVSKQDANSPWVVIESSTDPRSSILPNGVFQFNSRTVTLPTNVNGDHFVGGLSLYTPNQGDAFEVTGSGITEESTFGRVIETGDVIVSKTDDPNLVLTSSNDDWLIIKDAGHGELTLRELRFLATITERDTFTDSRVELRNDVSAVRVWLSPYILDHAPFITPVSDPNNPQSGQTTSYIGGDPLTDSTSDFVVTNSNDLTPFTGESGSSILPSALLYVDIDGSFSVADNINNIFIVHRDADGSEIERFSLADDFRAITLTGSTDTYYVFDDVGATDNYSSINYHLGQKLEVVLRSTNREFVLGDDTDVIDSIDDGSITLSKLDPTTQAVIRSNQGLSAVQEAKLAGLEDTTTNTPIPDNTQFYIKLDEASSSNDLSHYVRLPHSTGFIPNYERTRSIFFLSPTNVIVNGLQKVEDTSQKLSVTEAANITTTNGQNWIAYRATLPAITGANSVLDNAWQVDGTIQNIVLSGAASTFKVDRDNVSDTLATWIESLVPDSPTPTSLPENLQQLSRHLDITTDTSSGWSKVEPNPIRAELTRQFAALWDENRRSFSGNYFQDLANVQVAGFNANNIFYYNSPTDPLNTSFAGAQSYILNDNVRFQNTSGGTNISTSRNKLISFNYSLQRELSSTDNLSMLQIGPSSSTPLLGLAREEGLYLNIGRGDGGQQTRTYDSFFQVDNNQWHVPVGQTVSDEAEIIIPDDLTGSLTFKVTIHLDNNGNDEGNHEETFTITNVGADQNLGNRTFTYTNVDGHSGSLNLTLSFNYDHDNNDLSRTRRVVFLRTVTALQNAAFTYNITASRSITETWNVPTTYARFPVNAGSGHDDFGLFDPTRYTTEGVRQRNRVILELQPYRDGDTSSDPEMAVRVVVDGETETSNENDNLIRLHRPASDFTFNNISFGNNNCAVAHIQCYDYTGSPPSSSELQTLYSQQANWLGAFWPPNHAVDRVSLDANFEVSSGHHIILTSPNGTRYSLSLLNDGTLDTNEVT